MSLLKKFQHPEVVLRKLTGEALMPNGTRRFVVLKEFDLAYGRIPKAANSTIKSALFDLLALENYDATRLSHDAFWRHVPDGRTDLLTARQLQKQHPGAFVFSFTRNPFSRVTSCYFNKIMRKKKPASNFRRRGFSHRMKFADFVERVASNDDRSTDRHLMSQCRILMSDGKVVPEFIGRVESIDHDWNRLTQLVMERGGPQLGVLGHRNKSKASRPSDAELFCDPALVRMVRHRYAGDFENFYPELDDPGA